MALRLMVEESKDFRDFDYLIEKNTEGSKNTLYISGPYMMAEGVNRNGRLYPLEEMQREVARYKEEMIATGRSMGELNHPNCNTKDADILTASGWKSIVDVKEGDLIQTLNLETNCIEIHPVKKKIEQPYKGKMYRLVGRNIDVTVTPKHRFPLVDRYGNKELVEIETVFNDRKKFNKSYIPKLGDWSSDVDSITIPAFTDTNPNYHKHEVTQDLIISSTVFAKFMGIWLAEGYTITRSKNATGYVVGISQRKEEVKLKIREMLEEFPLKWNETTNSSGTTTFSVSDARLYTYLHKLGNCYNKYIPEEVKQFSSSDLDELIYWFNLGDGRFNTIIDENGKEYECRNVFSTSKVLIDDLHECLLKSGGCGNISTIITEVDYKFADHIIKAENKVPLYQLSIASTKGIYLDDRFLKIEELDFDDNVYCVQVKNETFYCRENGKSFWSGNSPDVDLGRACHLVTELRQEGDIFYGKSKVLSTDCGKIVKCLVEDGVKVGMSSRALGRLEEAQGKNIVRDLRLVCVDCVADPSFPKAFVNGILESKQWVLQDNGTLQECYETFEKSISKLPRLDVEAHLKKSIMSFLKNLK